MAFVAWLIPWKRLRPFLPHIAIAGLLGLVVWWIDHQGYQRARDDADRRAAKLENVLRSDLRQSEARLAGTIMETAGKTRATIDAIDLRSTTIIKPTITKEIAREARLSDPALGLSDGLRAAVNRALPPVTCGAPAPGRLECSLPDAVPAPQQ